MLLEAGCDGLESRLEELFLSVEAVSTYRGRILDKSWITAKKED